MCCLTMPLPQALRLTMVQILINSKGLSMNPLQSLYYVSPACMISLLLPFCESLADCYCFTNHYYEMPLKSQMDALLGWMMEHSEI